MTQSMETAPPPPGVSPPAPVRRPIKAFFRRLGDSEHLLRFGGRLAGGYLRLVGDTARVDYEPGDPADIYRDVLPIIVTIWHSQIYSGSALWPSNKVPLVSLISKHRDGEFMAAAVRCLGISAIRGSGGRGKADGRDKGAVRGFLQMRSTLAEGTSVFISADVPKGEPERVGPGVVKLASVSGRPIVSIGIASARKFTLNNSERSEIGIPFSKTFCVVAKPVMVPPRADEAMLEAKRIELQQVIEAANRHAKSKLGMKDG